MNGFYFFCFALLTSQMRHCLVCFLRRHKERKKKYFDVRLTDNRLTTTKIIITIHGNKENTEIMF